MTCRTHNGSGVFHLWGGDRPSNGKTSWKSKLKPAVSLIGMKTRWANSPEVIAANLGKFEVTKKREEEVKDFVSDIIRDRREQQIKELLSPYQLNTMSHPALLPTQERLFADSIRQRNAKLSCSPVVSLMNWKSSKRSRHQDVEDIVQEEELSESSSFTNSRGSSLNASLSKTSCPMAELDGTLPSSEIFNYSSESTLTHSQLSMRKEQIRELTKQYLALMTAVDDHKQSQSEKIVPEKELYVGALKDALQALMSDLEEHSSKIILPDQQFFHDCFSIETSLSWMSVEIKEFISLPECLISSIEDVERSESAAFLRNAAWDHYFFEHSKPGTKFPSPFGKFEEGETPADKFLYPSRPVRNLNTASCLWKQLTDKKVLEHFMKYVEHGKHMEIPKYLKQCGYMEKIHESTFESNQNLNFIREKKSKADSAYEEFVRYEKARSRCFSHLAYVRRAKRIPESSRTSFL